MTNKTQESKDFISKIQDEQIPKMSEGIHKFIQESSVSFEPLPIANSKNDDFISKIQDEQIPKMSEGVHKFIQESSVSFEPLPTSVVETRIKAANARLTETNSSKNKNDI